MTTTKNSIQQKLTKLDGIVKYFESQDDGFDLDEAVGKYEEAMQMVTSVKKELHGIELKINEIQKKYEEGAEEDD